MPPLIKNPSRTSESIELMKRLEGRMIEAEKEIEKIKSILNIQRDEKEKMEVQHEKREEKKEVQQL